jgi:hypothetical protein
MQPTDGLDALQVRAILVEELGRRPGDYLWILLNLPAEISEEDS